MANIPARGRHIIYDWATYKTDIPLSGEREYFSGVFTGQQNNISVLGNGVSAASTLSFIETLIIHAAGNVNLNDLRIAGNHVLIYNTSGGTITVNIGTTGVPININLLNTHVIKLYFTGAVWNKINSDYYYATYTPAVADGGGAYQDGYVEAWREETQNGLTRFYGWGWIEVDNTNDAVKMNITMPITFSTARRILGDTNGRTTAGEGAPSGLLDVNLNVSTRAHVNVGFEGAALLSVRIVKEDGVFANGDFYTFSFDILGEV